ncbi:cyclin-dependent kinase inhibitor 1C [Pangasianodon hypophthalmus]|uniref:cyclin-dependent kinase inhibitor 1C n=1 Tax=Pangasianodon hypophthalmus TaxID=310915 RepID=UPI002306E5AC|nr:cyclin-dependent kinase inhibitor 1C [Pangasianodon hypophthalmus]
MTSVQLSVCGLGAARERVPQHARRRSACRSLFGAVDHDELNRDMEARLRELSERDQKRWNFDFAAGTPLLGEYEWEAAAAEATPAFYQETVQAGKKRAAAATVTPRTETPHRESASAGQPSCTRARRAKRRKTSARAAPARARIPDFYVKRRKQGEIKLPESESQIPFSSLSSEQTPRKRLR